MELSHRFTVPDGVEETWAHFKDIAAVAECFPGAQVTSADGDTSPARSRSSSADRAASTTGPARSWRRTRPPSGSSSTRRARTSAATARPARSSPSTMTEAGDGHRVVVVTDLAITGKPAQFGRGVMQDVSDKLLGQFVACLEERLTAPGESAGDGPAPAPAPRRTRRTRRAGQETGGTAADAPGATEGARGARPRKCRPPRPREDVLEASPRRPRVARPPVVARQALIRNGRGARRV